MDGHASKVPAAVFRIGISMSGEVSYFSRFLVKFVEIIAAGLASAISAYMLAHFGGVLLSSPTPASAPVTPTASLLVDSVRAQPIPPLAAASVNERRAVPQKDTDALAVQLAPNAGQEAKMLPLRKHAKTDASVADKGSRALKSTELPTRAALTNIEANRRARPDALIGPGLNNDPAAFQPPSPTNIDPQLSSIPTQAPRADQENDVFSALRRIPDLLRPEPPVVIGEAPRPPMPVVTASPERESGK
jgi:hypothetical protein